MELFMISSLEDLKDPSISDSTGESLPKELLEELGQDPWLEVIGDRKFKCGVIADFGLGDAVVAFLEFEDDTFEVGHGECMRPYQQIYLGSDRGEASSKFVKYVKKLM